MLTCCEVTGENPLTEDLLWQVAEGLFQGSVWLDTLEDFTATQEELEGMQNKILQIWRKEDSAQAKPSSLRPKFISKSKGG